MRVLVLASVLLFANCAINNHEADSARYKTAEGYRETYKRLVLEAFNFTVSEKEAGDEKSDPYDARDDWLYRLYLAFTILGVIAGIGGVVAIYKQTKATTKAAQATEDSVKLQQVALRQWVNIRNWKSWIPDRSNRPSELRIEFEVVNPTRAPLVIRWSRITAQSGALAVSGFPENAMLIPDNPHFVSTLVELTQMQRLNYSSPNGLVLSIEGAIAYTDALRDKWRQEFKLTLQCSPSGTEPSNYIHTLYPET
jgi:hypothetical protein